MFRRSPKNPPSQNPPSHVTQGQYDASARALFEHITGTEAGDDSVSFDNDAFFVLARVALEGAGLEVP